MDRGAGGGTAAAAAAEVVVCKPRTVVSPSDSIDTTSANGSPGAAPRGPYRTVGCRRPPPPFPPLYIGTSSSISRMVWSESRRCDEYTVVAVQARRRDERGERQGEEENGRTRRRTGLTRSSSSSCWAWESSAAQRRPAGWSHAAMQAARAPPVLDLFCF